MDRRHFLSRSLATAAAVGAFGSLASASSAMAPPVLPAQPLGHSARRFRALIGSRFLVKNESGSGETTHATLGSVRPGPTDPRLEQFTLVFSTGGPDVLEPGVYAMHHADTGWFPVALSGDKTTRRRVAVFNLLS